MWRTAGVALVALAAMVGGSYAQASSPDGLTTESQSTVAGGPFDPAKPGFLTTQAGSGWSRVVRELAPGMAQAGRDTRRSSLAYFAQLSDFQLADEESPARLEFGDFIPPFSAAWRPQEALNPFGIDYAIRQINNFTGASPVAAGNGSHASMDLALTTGDNADSQQQNENLWVRQLIEGGQPLNPNSGVKSATYSSCDPVAAVNLKLRELLGLLPNEPVYTGVSDYSDHPFNTTQFYDPDQPAGPWADWPLYGGLLDRAQQTFTPVGLRRGGQPLPTYLSNGNHDTLVQGNAAANAAFELIGTGCFKPFVPAGSLPPGGDPLQALLNGVTGFNVRPDPARRYVNRPQLKAIYGAGSQADDHGFAFVDPTQNTASNNAASYYAWNPKPGLRFVALDTVSEGGVIGISAEGNLDDPQWQWLQGQIATAEAADELVVVFGHHPVRSLTAQVPDEIAPPCTIADGHGHDVNPGCDLDPRVSLPIHLGADLGTLLSAHPNVIAYVTGHTHENNVLPCAAAGGCPAGGNWWEINTSAEVDWPQQSRLLEVMDNDDGTLSIFGTLLDHSAPFALPAPTANASGFTNANLASLSRAFSLNDPHGSVGAVGQPEDRNVELLVDDPR
jgi:metallophosphoesterase (TIGR03767 family)